MRAGADPDAPGRRRLFAGARTRILASYVILLIFSTLVSLFALYEILATRVGDRVDNTLIQETREFRKLVVDGRDPRTGRPFGGDVKAIFGVFLSRNVPGEGEAFFTFLDGRPYLTSSNARLGPRNLERVRSLSRTPRSVRGEVETRDGHARYLAVPVRVRGTTRGVFAVTNDVGQELDEVDEALEVAAGVSIAVLLLASLLAWFIAGRVLAPLRLLGTTARSITSTDLTRRIPTRGHDEVAELARTFNAMLDRLEIAFGSQKAFISDAGHELRTPITIIRGHLELVGDDPAERRETVELVLDELDRMSRLVDDLILLAKAERPDFLRLEELDLDLFIKDLFAKLSALAPRDWRLEENRAGRIVADRQRMTQAVVNLGQNAVQHTREGDQIALGAELRNGSARLWVRDTGEGMKSHDADRIFARFARGAASRHEGLGLGLAIVRAVAEAHGGQVEVRSRPGSGSIFTVVIPAEPSGPPDRLRVAESAATTGS